MSVSYGRFKVVQEAFPSYDVYYVLVIVIPLEGNISKKNFSNENE